MPLAYAHASGEAAASVPPQGTELLLAWTFDPTFLVPLAIGWLYFRGLRAFQQHRRSPFRPWRLFSLTLGVAGAGLALVGPVDRLADFSFAWHMGQHMLIAQVSVPLILLGAPFVPVIRGLPARFRWHTFVPFAQNWAVRRFFLAAIHPVVAFVCYVGALWAWHYPPAYDLALRNEMAHYFEHFCFVATSMQMHWHIVNPYPFRSRLHYLVRAAFLFVVTMQNGALGALITFSDQALYGYGRLESFWGLTMAEDQIVGGLLMWVGGGMMHLAVILIILIVYAVEEERKEPHHPLYAQRKDALRPA
jgi:cytochrome c oxidase assembly factor CtaG